MTVAKEPKTVDTGGSTGLVRQAELERTSGEARILRRNGEDNAALTPSPLPPSAPSRVRPVTRDDALFRLIGIGQSGIPGGVSEKKHTLLADAYRPQ